MALSVRSQPYRLDYPSSDGIGQALPGIITNADEMFQILFEQIAELAAAIDALSPTTTTTASTPSTSSTQLLLGFFETEGEQGDRGQPGPVGAAGTIGVNGFPGPPGEDGLTGEDGFMGFIGVPGATGAAGSQGPMGPAGPALLANDGEDGESWPIVAVGPQGNQGTTGAQGPMGVSMVQEDVIYPDDLMIAPAAPTSGGGSSGSPWSLISSNSPSGVTTVDFTGLAAYTDLRVIVQAMTFGTNSRPQLRVSINNGSTFLAASGDYVGITGAGAPVNATELDFMDANSTVSRNGELFIEGINVTGAPKSARSNFFNSDAVMLRLIPTTSAITAIRVFATQNFTGGTIYVYGRV